MNKEKKDRPSIEAPQAVKHPDKHPPCYRSETRNPYPLCLGWGMKACAHCCLWTDYDSDEDESRVNLPLSLAQLQEMDGTPAWWECGPEYSCWGIIAVDSSGRWEGIPFFQGRWREVNFVYNIEARNIRDIMTIAAMMVICFIIMMVMSSLTLPFPLVYLYGSAGIDGFICAVFFLVAANRVNKHGLLFAWAGIYGLIQGVMGYMFLFPYFLAVGLIAELSMLGKDTYRNPLRTRIGWTINCVGNFVGCAVPLWWAWDSYTAMALESGFTSETLEMQMAMVTSPALMLLGAAITAVLTFLGTLFGQRLLRKHFQKAGIVG